MVQAGPWNKDLLGVAHPLLRSGPTTPRGNRPRTAAVLASLTSTCRWHEVDPQVYLTQLLVNLPSVRMKELAEWLPDEWKRWQAERATSLGVQAP